LHIYFFNPEGNLKMKKKIALVAMAAFAVCAQAADWSDTAISLRHGTNYAEPFNSNAVTKTIVGLTHASGFKYGSNFFNADLLMSNQTDPSAFGSKTGAHEVYVVFQVNHSKQRVFVVWVSPLVLTSIPKTTQATTLKKKCLLQVLQ